MQHYQPVPVPVPPVKLRPYGWSDNENEPQFEATIHLAPELTHDDDAFSQIRRTPLPSSDEFGFSEPFKVFSDEGLHIVQDIIRSENEKGFVQPDRRIQLCLRGVAYRSPFLRAFSQTPEITNLVSSLTGKELIVHPIISNHAHVNWGEPADATGEVKSVDQWHLDSVTYVLIVLLSDMEGAVGGDLEFMYERPNEAFDMIRKNTIDAATTKVTVKFPAAGYGVLLMGSELVHHVTPLISSTNPRLTLIQSFRSADPWTEPDRTRWNYYANAVSAPYSGYEWMHYQSWKLGGQLISLPTRVGWDAGTTLIAGELRRIARDLQVAADQIEGKVTDDEVVFIDEKKQQQQQTMM